MIERERHVVEGDRLAIEIRAKPSEHVAGQCHAGAEFVAEASGGFERLVQNASDASSGGGARIVPHGCRHQSTSGASDG
jgi:hypothetical protein